MELFFALLAVVIAFMALMTQRAHNRKEMLPVLHNYYASSYNPDSDNHTYELILFNDGLGVALLESVYVTLADGTERNFERYTELSDFILTKFPENVEVICSLPYALKGNHSETIYKVTVSEEQHSDFEELKFTFKARSIYGDCVETKRGKLYEHRNSFTKLKEDFSNLVKAIKSQ